ncbi:hypothetical protein X943_001349 [Babesia divergens]|uniref:Uncharacterized protein n=1 Tax=Babesia divergens TaxID=32595 RepID=A0AAD9GKI2_BABDI|nr:hypothetical protein X943_001349 [Babesia divergens]
MTPQPQLCCRSRESKGHSSADNGETGQQYAACVRYSILSCAKSLNGEQNDRPLGNIGIFDLSGDVPQLLNEQRNLHTISQVGQGQKSTGEPRQNVKKHKNAALNTMNIERCFDINPKHQLSRSSTVESYVDIGSTWGRLTTSLPLFEGGEEPSSARRDGRIALTIGNHVIHGKYTDVASGNHVAILRKVPRHCSCACSTADSHENDCRETHDSYFEICAVTSAKLLFTGRPSFIQHYKTNENDTTWSIFQPQDIDALNQNWLLLNVTPGIVEAFYSETAYFKVINDSSGASSRLVINVNGETFYLERLEVGGKLVLVTPMNVALDQVGSSSVLSIIGCCKFVHNMVKAVPNFRGLPKTGKLSLESLLDSLPLGDEQIKLFLMNRYPEWPCPYVCLQDGIFAYLDIIIWAEFSVKFMPMLSMYLNQNQACKKHIQDLTMQDMWDMVQTYPQVLESLPTEMRTLSVIFQILRAISDLKHPLTEFEDYMDALSNEGSLLNVRMVLNLFKIHKIVVMAVGTASEGMKMTYDNLVKKVDSLLFTQAVPSYIFDEMIQYLINNVEQQNEDYEDYTKCLRCYYADASFSDVTSKMTYQFKKGNKETTQEVRYDLTGVRLFAVAETSDGDMTDDFKKPCFNYDIFKINTKGLAKLRFNYAMNSLIALCRTPISLHLAFVADMMVATVEGSVCTVKMYPKEKEDTLRDSLSSLFKLTNKWHLEVIDKKLARFWGTKLALESITGPPNFHTRLWITTEKNNFNYTYINRCDDESRTVDRLTSRKDKEGGLQPIEEESYIIINSNVPV